LAVSPISRYTFAAITSADANIARAQIRTFSSQRALNTFEVMIKSSEHLKEVLQNISKVQGVYKAVRGRGRMGSSDGMAKTDLQ
jgi:(p)ppGpp synthase/HD superfamily hydrolase